MARRIAPRASGRLFDATAAQDAFYHVHCCAEGHVHVAIGNKPQESDITELVFDPEAAYDFAESILRGYDFLAGIGFPRGR